MKFALIKKTKKVYLETVELTESQYIDVATELLLRGWQKEKDRFFCFKEKERLFFVPSGKIVSAEQFFKEINFESVEKLLEWYE